MPLHLQSITDDDQEPEYLTDLLTMSGKEPDELFVSENKFILSRFALTDEISGTSFGKLVITMKVDDEQNAVLIIDLDITLDNKNRTAVHFLAMREGSSDSNEYYDAMTEDDDIHFELETVCRHTVPEALAGCSRDASISAFPFQLSVYESIDDFNKWAGFGKEIKVGDTDFTVHGFSEHFMMPGGTLGGKKEDDESYSFLLGKVLSWKNVRWKLGENAIDFLIVRLDTALGEIPAAMSREVFDLSGLKKGAIIAMNADIKADLSGPEDFIKKQSEE